MALHAAYGHIFDLHDLVVPSRAKTYRTLSLTPPLTSWPKPWMLGSPQPFTSHSVEGAPWSLFSSTMRLRVMVIQPSRKASPIIILAKTNQVGLAVLNGMDLTAAVYGSLVVPNTRFTESGRW